MEKVIKQLHTAIDGLLNSNIQNINWNNKPDALKWSKKEIMGHLIDSAQINLQRFIRCTYEENFKLTYEQVEWVAVQHYQDADITDLLTLWKLLNYQILTVLKNYPANRLFAKCDNSKNTITLHTVKWLAQDYVDHLTHHLNQVYNR